MMLSSLVSKQSHTRLPAEIAVRLSTQTGLIYDATLMQQLIPQQQTKQRPAALMAAHAHTCSSARGRVTQHWRFWRALRHGVQDALHVPGEAHGGAVCARPDVQRAALLQRPHLAVRHVAHQRRDLREGTGSNT